MECILANCARKLPPRTASKDLALHDINQSCKAAGQGAQRFLTLIADVRRLPHGGGTVNLPCGRRSFGMAQRQQVRTRETACKI
jgi:hypothetical protein